jgi:hypothetical protein
MLLVLRLFLIRWLAARTLGGVLAGLVGVALPTAAVLKVIGLPVLAVAGVIGAPVAFLLAVLGLPVAIVLSVVGVVAAVAAGAALLGLVVLKYVLPALLVGWLIARLFRTLRRRTDEVDARRAAMASAPVEGAAPEPPIV